MRIMQISDVHFSSMTSPENNTFVSAEVIRAVDELRPEIIVITGDLVSRHPGETGILDAVNLVKALCIRVPVFYVMGNHEVDLSRPARKCLLRLLEEAGAVLLNNRTTEYKGVKLCGLVMPHSYYKNDNRTYQKLPEVTGKDVCDRIGKAPEDAILLTHNPIWMPAYAKWGASVVFAGHVHGGVIRVPVLGGMLSPERKFFPAYSKGCYDIGRTRMVVSAGIGKLRVNNPAEIVLVELKGNAG